MKYVGIDLHKKTISGCVVVKERGKRKIANRRILALLRDAAFLCTSGTTGTSVVDQSHRRIAPLKTY